MTTYERPRFSERNILVDFTISRWLARRKDDELSRQVTKANNAPDKSATVRKNLFPFEAPTYDAITTIVNEARTFHRNNTLPWADGDLRILPTKNFMEYMQTMREFRSRFEMAVNLFIPDALRTDTGLFAQSREKLNGMAKAEDYPNAARLVQRHKFEVSRFPLPDAEDFRVQDELNLAEIAAMKSETETAVKSAVESAMNDLWTRLYERVNEMAERLKDEKGRVTSAMFDNLNALVDLLPRLNIAEDPRLTTLAAEVKAKLSSQSPKAIRNSKRYRQNLAAEAERIAASMQIYVGK